MIDDVLAQLENGMFADHGAIWKRGRNLGFVVKKVQEAVCQTQEWSLRWGFQFSVDKTKTM